LENCWLKSAALDLAIKTNFKQRAVKIGIPLGPIMLRRESAAAKGKAWKSRRAPGWMQ
jgi:hypothetical protein